MQIRVAKSKDELEGIYRFRYEVYVEEMARALIEADPDTLRIVDPLDATGIQIYAENKGEVIGVCRLNLLRDTELPRHLAEGLQLGRFEPWLPHHCSYSSRLMVRRTERGAAIAALLIRSMYTITRERSMQFHFLYCREQLLRFYERTGCRRYAPAFVDHNGTTGIPVVGVLEDVDYLMEIGSALGRIGREFHNRPEAANWFQETIINPQQIRATASRRIVRMTSLPKDLQAEP